MTANKVNEEMMVHIVRNALLVAGREMGDDGDQNPVVKSTIHALMRDWENLKTERNVFAEVRTQCDLVLAELERMRETADTAFRAEIDKALTDLRDLYQAAFSDVALEDVYVDPNVIPLHIKRADQILKTLEAKDE